MRFCVLSWQNVFVKYESERQNIRRLEMTKTERFFYFVGTISGWTGALLAGFFVGLIYAFIFFMLPDKNTEKAALYFICASILAHLFGALFCQLFRLNKFLPLIVPFFATVGMFLFAPLYRCLAFGQCDLSGSYQSARIAYPFYASIFVASFVLVGAVASIEPAFLWLKNYHNNSSMRELSIK